MILSERGGCTGTVQALLQDRIRLHFSSEGLESVSLTDHARSISVPIQYQVWLDQYFLRQPVCASALFAPVNHVSEFRRKVWQAIETIPFGEVRTYQQIAEQIVRPNAIQAVGTAVASNPCVLFRPCHRVVPSRGGPGQFVWGTRIKIQLLAHEGLHF